MAVKFCKLGSAINFQHIVKFWPRKAARDLL